MFNLSLLGKWRWRFLVDTEACWYKILQSRYGNIGQVSHQYSCLPKNSSQWWGDLCALDSDKGASVNWFIKGVCRWVGNGENTRFWLDTWFGDRILKEAFPRLFSLSTDKSSMIDKFGHWCCCADLVHLLILHNLRL